MNKWRITINRTNGKATVEVFQGNARPDKPWGYMGVVFSRAEAERLIRDGWPSFTETGGIHRLFDPGIPQEVEVVT